MTTTRRVAVLLAVALVAVLPACQIVGRGEPGSGEATTTSGQAQNGPGETTQQNGGPGTGGQPTGSTGQPGTGGQPTGGPAPPGGGQPPANLTASPDNGACSLTPAGDTASSAAALQFFFYIVLVGANPDQLSALISVSARSDSGATASSRNSVSNQAQTLVSLPLGASDLGRRHNITITVDDTSEVPETDEADNTLKISLDIPNPPTYGDLPCSMTRG